VTEPAQRRAELADALRKVQHRIAAAAVEAGRNPAQIRLVAVTKTFPASDAALLADLGVTDIGENRDQEAAAKAQEVRRLRPGAAIRWHMVGRLQRNKAKSVAGWADVVQSVDSDRLARALHAAVLAAMDQGRRHAPLDVLIQASLDGDPARGGCPLPQLPVLAEHVATLTGLRLKGVMAVAPLGADPERALAELARAAAAIREQHPDAEDLSAGMTADLGAAIRHGSTCVRVGTALLGGRPLASP
jgi:pyridoxal phosphate enzyme (YggS family)